MTVVLVCVVLLLLIVIWSIRRHRAPTLRIDCRAPIEELIPSLAGLTLSTAVAGPLVTSAPAARSSIPSVHQRVQHGNPSVAYLRPRRSR